MKDRVRSNPEQHMAGGGGRPPHHCHLWRWGSAWEGRKADCGRDCQSLPPTPTKCWFQPLTPVLLLSEDEAPVLQMRVGGQYRLAWNKASLDTTLRLLLQQLWHATAPIGWWWPLSRGEALGHTWLWLWL